MFNKVAGADLYFGSYPSADSDIQRLHQAGVTQVINLQTEEEMRFYDIQVDEIQHSCAKRGMKFTKAPLKDFEEGEYCFDLFRIAQKIHHIVDVERQSLLIHCSSGITRSPTLALVYLCLFKKIEHWKNPHGSFSYLKDSCKEICPNMKAVERTLKHNHGFQQQQQSRYGSNSKTSRQSQASPLNNSKSPRHFDDRQSVSFK